MKPGIKGIGILIAVMVCVSGCSGNGGTDAKQEPEQKKTELPKETVIQEVDFSDCFGNWYGCAVFYNNEANQYQIYNRAASETQYSPCSTFKIVSAMMGLEEGVLADENSKMNYDGSIYPRDAWNANLTLQEAFQTSCVWYFRQVIDQVGQVKVQETLAELGYGNCDISQWEGSGLNPTPDTNGFWIESSLKLSPKEQVEVLVKIFEKEEFASEHTQTVLESIMLVSAEEGISLYGKTGSGGKNGWFTGFFEKEGQRWYFAVNLQDPNRVTGQDAKEVAGKIIRTYY